jgi:2-succinyl-6-hydroxy-2,4-cyclohexadiene-1-carboxylate synthase
MTLRLAMLHGFTGSPASFDEVRSRLGRDITVVAPRLVGHGDPADARVHDFAGEVDRIAALLRGAGPRWYVLGYSLGGRVALGLLVRHPTLLAGATLIGAQPGIESENARDSRRADDERLARLLETDGMDAFIAKWEALPLFATQASLDPGVLERQRTERRAHDPRELARSLRTTGLGVMPSYWNSLGAIPTPVRLAAGTLDHKFATIAREMAREMPRSTVELVEGVGHNVVLEGPAAVVEMLKRGVAETEGGTPP